MRIPERTCVSCRVKRPKRELTRVVVATDGQLQVDQLARQPGRGVYFCAEPSCRKEGIRKRSLERALRASLAPMALERLAGALATIGDEQ
jgi:predicted RNA-binding protein YlxR (DUF448 family)